MTKDIQVELEVRKLSQTSIGVTLPKELKLREGDVLDIKITRKLRNNFFECGLCNYEFSELETELEPCCPACGNVTNLFQLDNYTKKYEKVNNGD